MLNSLKLKKYQGTLKSHINHIASKETKVQSNIKVILFDLQNWYLVTT